MKEFHDTKDRTWQLAVTCDTIEQVKEACGVNLLDLADPDTNLLKEVNAFPPLLGKLLFAALVEQAKVKEVDEREFKRSMSGDRLVDALDVLLDEILLFCPQHRRRLLQAVLEKNKEVEAAGVDLALERLNDPELSRQALAAMDAQVKLQIEESLRVMGPSEKPAAPLENPLETGSSTSVGLPPDSSTSPAQALTPGDGSSGSPMGPGGPTVG